MLCRRRSTGMLIVLSGVLVAALSAVTPPTARAQDAGRGAQLYEQMECSTCHAAEATGGLAVPLAGTSQTLEEFRAQLRDPIGMMTAFGPDRLSDEDIVDIHAWLQSLPSEPVYPTWFSTDLINLPTPLMPGEKTFEVHFSHRFFQSIRDAGRQGLGGLDSFAFPAFWFAYGIVDGLEVHGGRSSNRSTWEYGAKVELLEEDRLSVPVSVSAVLGGAYLDLDAVADKNRFTAEFPIGFRIHDRVSLMVVPFLATNTDPSGNPISDSYSTAIGIGGSFRMTPGQSIDIEWVSNLGGFEQPDGIAQWQVFWGIKVGGHVFQIGVSNSFLYTPDQMAPGTVETGAKSDVRIGFNLVRAFTFGGGES
ncbi:MAG: c-type cytochrome [Acidobacteria bacterium]|nr:c-type cytochrome [Acidobacteriota bacterium]